MFWAEGFDRESSESKINVPSGWKPLFDIPSSVDREHFEVFEGGEAPFVWKVLDGVADTLRRNNSVDGEDVEAWR